MAALNDDKFYKMVVPRAEMNSREIAHRVNRNHELAQALNIRGTPGFVIAGKVGRGAFGTDALLDQYSLPENRVTYSLVTALHEDRELLRAFLTRIAKNPLGTLT